MTENWLRCKRREKQASLIESRIKEIITYASNGRSYFPEDQMDLKCS